MSPKDSHTLIHEMCAAVTLHDKSRFADPSKSRLLRWGWMLVEQWLSCHLDSHYRRKQEGQSQAENRP